MTQVPQDDGPLIRFLKQHRPTPPATITPVEAQLMQLVNRDLKRFSRKQARLFWIVPSAIAVAGLVIWLGFKGSDPSPQLAVQPEELESFVVDSWNGAIGDLSYATYETDTETSWLILEDSETDRKNKTNH